MLLSAMRGARIPTLAREHQRPHDRHTLSCTALIEFVLIFSFGVVPPTSGLFKPSAVQHPLAAALSAAPHASGEPVRLLREDDPLLRRLDIATPTRRLVRNEGAGRRFNPEEGIVSFYHEPQKLASGGHFNPEKLTAAHKSLPFGTIVRCTRLDTGESTLVTINDRGPFIRGRKLDLSRAAARQIGLLKGGITPARIEVVAYPVQEGKTKTNAPL